MPMFTQESCRDMSLLTFFLAATAAAVIGRAISHPPDPDSLVCISRANMDKMQNDITELELLREKLNVAVDAGSGRRLLADLVSSPADAGQLDDDTSLQTAKRFRGLDELVPGGIHLRAGSRG